MPSPASTWPTIGNTSWKTGWPRGLRNSISRVSPSITPTCNTTPVVARSSTGFSRSSPPTRRVSTAIRPSSRSSRTWSCTTSWNGKRLPSSASCASGRPVVPPARNPIPFPSFSTRCCVRKSPAGTSASRPTTCPKRCSPRPGRRCIPNTACGPRPRRSWPAISTRRGPISGCAPKSSGWCRSGRSTCRTATSLSAWSAPTSSFAATSSFISMTR